MAWDGTVKRQIVGATATPDGGCEILFECQHRQRTLFPALTILRTFREYGCDECSRPTREKIRRIQENVSFDDVLEKLRKLRADNRDE